MKCGNSPADRAPRCTACTHPRSWCPPDTPLPAASWASAAMQQQSRFRHWSARRCLQAKLTAQPFRWGGSTQSGSKVEVSTASCVHRHSPQQRGQQQLLGAAAPACGDQLPDAPRRHRYSTTPRLACSGHLAAGAPLSLLTHGKRGRPGFVSSQAHSIVGHRTGPQLQQASLCMSKPWSTAQAGDEAVHVWGAV